MFLFSACFLKSLGLSSKSKAEINVLAKGEERSRKAQASTHPFFSKKGNQAKNKKVAIGQNKPYRYFLI